MNKWIYLKSNNPADALALATVLSSSKDKFFLVRRSNISQFFVGLENVVADFYHPDEDSEIIIIDELSSDSWMQKCDDIAKAVNIESIRDYKPYCGFENRIQEIEERIGNNQICLLYLFPHPDQCVNLMVIDQVVRLLESQGIKSFSCGTSMLPCIKGTLDLRQIVDFAVLCAMLPKVSFVITSEMSTSTICEAFGKDVFVISQTDKLKINGNSMSDSNQIVNYINLNIKIK